MPENKAVLYEKADGVATITLNRPESFNSLNMQLLEEANEALTDAQEDTAVRVLVITAKGKSFCSGADLKMVNSWSETGELDKEAEKAFHKAAGAMFDAIEKCKKPVIAAVNGFAIAGGFEICLWSDLIIAAEEAKIGDGHATYMIMGPISPNILPRQIGYKKAMELLLTGDLWPAKELERVGFVNKVVPADKLAETARELALNIAAKSPIGSTYTKAIAKQAIQAPVEAVSELAFSLLHRIALTKDRTEGAKAFAEKRKPNFTGE
jgi:enoyl-CoA hydratase/carnithine racemase